MARYTFLWVLGGTVVALLLAMLLAPSTSITARDLPWQIEPHDGTLTVFGITLNQTTLQQAEAQWAEPAEVTLFIKGERRVVEAYFDSVALAQIRAKVVLTVTTTAEQIEGLYQRGVRIAKMGDGSHKVTLSEADRQWLYQQPIRAITYLPSATLTETIIRQRFGEPAERLTEPTVGVHWLYPHLGLDLLQSERGKAVLQYLPPVEFQTLMEPLQHLKPLEPSPTPP